MERRMLNNSDLELQFKKWKWISYTSLMLPYLIVYFHRVALSVVADNLMMEFNISSTLLGTLASMYFIIYALLQIPSGILSDFWGPRKTVTVGIFLAGVGTIILGLAPSVMVLFLGRIIMSIGVSVIFIAILKIQSEWFMNNEFCFITGITTLTGNIGAIIAATPLALLVQLYNWRTSFVLVGLISLISAFITLKYTKDSPSSLGLTHPDRLQKTKRFSDQKVIPDKTQRTQIHEILQSTAKVLLNRSVWPLAIAFFGIYGALFTYTGIWGVPYLMQVHGMTKEVAANHMLATAIGVIIGCPSIGYLSDKKGRRKPVFIIALVILLCSWTVLTFFSTFNLPGSWLLPLSFIIGLSAPCFILIWACSKEVNPPDIEGISMGVVNMVGYSGAAIMQYLVGFILQQFKGEVINGVTVYPDYAYQNGFLACWLGLLLSFISVLMIKETYNKNIFYSS
jgi:sugar phosphate permease